jgi:hypothetical protein
MHCKYIAVVSIMGLIVNTSTVAYSNNADKHISCDFVLEQLTATQLIQKFAEQQPAQANKIFKLLFGDGDAVIKTHQDNYFRKFHLDLATGKITLGTEYTKKYAFDYAQPNKSTKHMLLLSEVVKKIENAGYSNIEFVQLTTSNYVAHVCYNNFWYDLSIDWNSGNITKRYSKPSLEIS